MTKETVFSKGFQHQLEVLENSRVEFIPTDLTKPKTLEALFEGPEKSKYDYIFHPASFWDSSASINLLRKINVEGTRNLLNLICETQDLNHLRFIHWSSTGVYGEPEYKYDKDAKLPIPCEENTLFNPLDDYELSKVEQELLVREFMEKKGLKCTILRPAPIYGPYQMYGIYHLLLLLKVIGHGIELLIHPKKKKLYFPSIHIEDTVLAAIFLSKQGDAVGEAYNLVHDLVWLNEWLAFLNQELRIRYTTLPTWFPLFKWISKIIAWITKIKNKKAKKLGIRSILDAPMVEYLSKQFAYSNQKLKDVGYKFKYDTWTGFKQTIKWYFENGWLPTERNKMKVY